GDGTHGRARTRPGLSDRSTPLPLVPIASCELYSRAGCAGRDLAPARDERGLTHGSQLVSLELSSRIEEIVELEDRRSKKDDEHGGGDQEDQREEGLDRGLLRPPFRLVGAPLPHLSGQTAQRLGDRKPGHFALAACADG